jgi:hypothetical protein
MMREFLILIVLTFLIPPALPFSDEVTRRSVSATTQTIPASDPRIVKWKKMGIYLRSAERSQDQDRIKEIDHCCPKPGNGNSSWTPPESVSSSGGELKGYRIQSSKLR